MLRPNALFTDGAVLCRNKPLVIFGQAEKGACVQVTLFHVSGTVLAAGTAAAGEEGFCVHLPPQEAQTGCTLEMVCGSETVTVRNVAIGEVWLAGGQSNMELALMNADGGPEEISGHEDPLLRFFEVPKWARACPEAELAYSQTRWQEVRPGQAGWVSAVAYWFARKRRADLGIPVGIIDCWWGGTSVTCWLDRESLELTEAGRAYLREEAAASAGITMEAYLAAEDRFHREMDAWNTRVSQAKARLGNETPWAEVEALAGPCPWNPPAGPGSPYRPGGLYEHMLRRVAPMRLTGILYYQGEEDTGRTDRYGLLMGQLITLWRRTFHEAELPFLFVQLPGWGGSGDHEAWPRLRWQQEEVYRALRNTGLAITIDLGDRENIHPTEKRPVGLRLAEQARRVVDGQPGQESPRIRTALWENNRVILLLTAPVRGPLTGFELRDASGVWKMAAAERHGNAICLRLTEKDVVRAARYAWLDWPEPTLFGENGLPLAPWFGEA